MPIDWKSPEAYQRLLAAIMAAQDGMKVCVLIGSWCHWVFAERWGVLMLEVFFWLQDWGGFVYGVGRGSTSGSILWLVYDRFGLILYT